MFIVNPIKKESATGELKLLYEMIEGSLGFIPPHFELFAAIDPIALKEFVEENIYMMSHKKIDKTLLPYLRLIIANKECRGYCKNFNTKLLLNMGADEKILNNIVQEIENIPVDEKQKHLLQKVLKALYEAEKFDEADLKELYDLNFSDKDFFDLLNYTLNFMSKSKMIEVYLR